MRKLLSSSSEDPAEQTRELSSRKVLSFGCSTGDEVRSLLRMGYGRVDGVEINEALLKEARERDPSKSDDSKTSFYFSNVCEIPAREQYDVIFAMAVLCRSPCKSPQTEFPFADFDVAVRLLDERLRLGGFLVVVNSQYDVRDASIGYRYSAEDCPGAKIWNSWTPGDFSEGSGKVVKFSKSGQQLAIPEQMPLLFQKKSASLVPTLCRLKALHNNKTQLPSFVLFNSARAASGFTNLKALVFGHGGDHELFAIRAAGWRDITAVDIDPKCNNERKEEDCTDQPFKRLYELNKIPVGTIFDTVFALSVLCSGLPESPISFDQFDAAVEALCSYVRVGGTFVVTNTEYDFRDTFCARNFVGIHLPPGERHIDIVAKLAPSGEPMPSRLSKGTPYIFQRIS